MTLYRSVWINDASIWNECQHMLVTVGNEQAYSAANYVLCTRKNKYIKFFTPECMKWAPKYHMHKVIQQ